MKGKLENYSSTSLRVDGAHKWTTPCLQYHRLTGFPPQESCPGEPTELKGTLYPAFGRHEECSAVGLSLVCVCVHVCMCVHVPMHVCMCDSYINVSAICAIVDAVFHTHQHCRELYCASSAMECCS